ncbi:unnamed protein product [Protopolystoma xenopodis]|uniref:RPRD1A/B C-terminal domain-containing protein n=1 Tax=Protopolystoma xenopodis TaxID=117903 RepID=A0A448XFQ8_9PLAT|nr:unnamed protein product [Protopolystoma xenopodis]
MELVHSLESFQSGSASADAAMRRSIAKFPPEVSDPEKASQILSEDSNKLPELLERITSCSDQLEAYNRRLEDEVSNINQLLLGLRAYSLCRHASHAERERTKDKIVNIHSKLSKLTDLRKELTSHVSNLPDLALLPSMTQNLDPLPPVGDLFG